MKTCHIVRIGLAFAVVAASAALPKRAAATSAVLPKRNLTKAELLAEVMRERGIAPADAVMVGDTKGDVTSGAAAGMYTIGCTWGYGTREELEGADEIYDTERFA